MAGLLQTFKFVVNVSNKYAVKNVLQSSFNLSQVRSLYSASSLGIDGYEQHRKRTETQLGNISEKFRTKMEEYTKEDSKNMIFTEDLKNMIHLATDNDVNLVIKMMTKFNEQNKQLRFGNFVFGPVVMRMFHFLNKPKEALDCFQSEKLQGFFDQLVTYQLLMDLLYENKMYKEILQTFEIIQSRQIEGTKYPRNIIVLTMAACYKINTPDSYKYALNLWNDLKEAGHFPMRRCTTFCAGLAHLQNAPEVCLEIATTAKNQNYTTVRNLKAISLAKLGRLDEAINMLKGVLETENTVKQTFNRDVVDSIKKLIESSSNADLQAEMTRLEKYFTEQGHFAENTLDEQLCEEIKPPAFLLANRQNQQFQQRGQLGSRFNKYQRDRPFRRDGVRYERPGLTDMQ